jgi:hypothetical protein
MNGVALAYAGVHQIFQMALAAHELGELEGLFCSIMDGKKKWGRRMGRLVPSGTARPLGSDALPSELVTEFPWPLLANRLAQKLVRGRRSDHLRSNSWFDRQAARWLGRSRARVYAGGETCALECLRVAADKGMKRVLDCPGVPSQVLDAEALKAAERFGVKIATSSNSPAMAERKKQELALADVVLCCSEFQRGHLMALNPQVQRSEVIPLWTDVDLWQPCVAKRSFALPGSPLRVLYAGALSLRKGVPYLLEAVEPLEVEVRLTLVGGISAEMEGLCKRFRSHSHRPYVTKTELKEIYQNHDVLVMPTLGDSFGFVTLEAMASGMPVIASRNAGAPVPDEGWRVEPHDAAAIGTRLLAYHADRELLRHHGEMAAAFGQGFRPENYRRRAGEVFTKLLS